MTRRQTQSFRFAVVLGAVVALWLPESAAAQPRPERPFRGLFGQWEGQAGRALTVDFAVGDGFDHSVVDENLPGATSPVRNEISGHAPVGAGSLLFAQRSTATSFTAGLTGTTVQQPSLSSELLTSVEGRVDWRAEVGRGLRLEATGLVAQQPYGFESLFYSTLAPQASFATSSTLDLALSKEKRIVTDMSAGFSYRLARRTTLSGNMNQRLGDVPGADSSFRYRKAAAAISHELARDLSLRIGYGNLQVRYPDGRHVPGHLLDFGVDFHRSLSISRRTTLGMTTGSYAVADQGPLRVTLVGDARLNHEMGRSWLASAGYSRSVLMNEVLREPVVADGITAEVGGLISRRLQFSSMARLAYGRVRESSQDAFTARNAGASLGVALSRNTMVMVGYYYFQQDFSNELTSVTPALSASRHNLRASLRFGGTVWRGRRNNASR